MMEREKAKMIDEILVVARRLLPADTGEDDLAGMLQFLMTDLSRMRGMPAQAWLLEKMSLRGEGKRGGGRGGEEGRGRDHDALFVDVSLVLFCAVFSHR